MHLLLSSTGRKLAGSNSTQGFSSSESRNYKKNVIETLKGMEPARGHWSPFGTERRAVGAGEKVPVAEAAGRRRKVVMAREE